MRLSEEIRKEFPGRICRQKKSGWYDSRLMRREAGAMWHEARPMLREAGPIWREAGSIWREAESMHREARHIRRRCFRRVRWQKYRKRWCRIAGLFAAAALYLLAAWSGSGKGWSVKEEYAAEICFPSAGQERQVVRLVFRLKTGELLFFHESTEIHNALP